MSEIEVGKEFCKFLEENGKVDEKGKTTLNLKEYREFLASQGLTKEVIEKTAAVEEEVTTGLYRYNAERVTAEVKKLVDEGKIDEAKKVKVETKITTPFGVRNMVTDAYRYRAPAFGSDKPTESTMVARDKIEESRCFNKELCTQCENEIKKLLGIEF